MFKIMLYYNQPVIVGAPANDGQAVVFLYIFWDCVHCPYLYTKLVTWLQERTLIGRPDAGREQDIQLLGLGIMPEHCVVVVNDNADVILCPLDGARSVTSDLWPHLWPLSLSFFARWTAPGLWPLPVSSFAKLA